MEQKTRDTSHEDLRVFLRAFIYPEDILNKFRGANKTHFMRNTLLTQVFLTLCLDFLTC
jgi:hypothetical protein